jgi:hypothetical protein
LIARIRPGKKVMAAGLQRGADTGPNSLATSEPAEVKRADVGNPMALVSPLLNHRVPKAMALMSRLSLWGQKGQIYSEEAFRHMLAIERKRAIRSNRSLLLLLVRFKGASGSRVEIPPAVSAALFSGLGLCVREIDFVGWHREGRIAGAVLAQGRSVLNSHAVPRIIERVIAVLRWRLSTNEAKKLDVRVIPLGRG